MAYATEWAAEAVVAESAGRSIGTLLGAALPIILIILVVAIVLFVRQKEPKEPSVKAMEIKSKAVAAILNFLLGSFGAHRFYLGYTKQGIIQVCGCVCLFIGNIMLTTGMVAGIIPALFGIFTWVWLFIDFIKILIDKLLPINGMPYGGKSASVVVAQTTSSVDALEKLAKLHQQGILTDEEFNQKKADLLAKM